MSIKVNGTDVIDNSRNIVGVAVTGSSDLSFGSGDTASRPASPTAGDIRYNSTVSKIEVYDGSGWRFLDELLNPDRGLFAGDAVNSGVIESINIATTGNASKFGELAAAKIGGGACSSSTRGIWGGGNRFTIDYVTISSAGNAIAFGDRTIEQYNVTACSNDTRGLFAGGGPALGNDNTIDYITIATTGNATDFGDLTSARGAMASVSSPTRALLAGGATTTAGGGLRGQVNTIDYVEIASVGNATDFGDLSAITSEFAGCSSPTRGLFAGGRGFYSPGGPAAFWLYYDSITSTGIANRSNAIDFGDLSTQRFALGATSNSIRGVFAGGLTPGATNIIEYVNIATTGNVTDFGDLLSNRYFISGCSASHGGLGASPGNVPTILTGDIGLFGGGLNTIDYISIASAGNATYFGDLLYGTTFIFGNAAACSSSTRGVFGGANRDAIEYVTISSTGGGLTFGSLTVERNNLGSCSNDTRGLFAGGGYSPVNDNTIDYITIATTGNATDFGDLTQARGYSSGCSSPTRAVFAGGGTSYVGGVIRGQVNTIDYVEIASVGNATDFGDLSAITSEFAGCSSPTRGLFAGGRGFYSPGGPAAFTLIYDSITSIGIANRSNAIDFGDLSATNYSLGATSNSIRGVFAGGITPVATNTIEYVNIATTGNVTDFGDLTSARYSLAGCSNSHGGLGASPGNVPTILTGDIGLFGGGFNTIDYISIASAGNASYFGDLIYGTTFTFGNAAACSSSTRGVFGGANRDAIEYVTISSTGGGLTFGSLTVERNNVGSCSNDTRGLFAGGGYSPANDNTIDYITIATTGNATDFGDLTQARGYSSGCSSPTRAVFAGGSQGPNPGNLRGQVNTMDYVEIASIGNATDFGDLSSIRGEMGGCSSPTRGLFGGGRYWVTPSQYVVNTIDVIGIANRSNATDFGDLTLARFTLGATSNSVRGVFAGGLTPGATNTIDYVTIATTGNAVDFGDLTSARYSLAGCSNSHGGLGASPGNVPTTLTGDIGIFGGGTSTIDYISIASAGNATYFGDLIYGTTFTFGNAAACSSSTRGVFGGANRDAIEYLTIASTGTNLPFGSLTVERNNLGSCSNDTRGLFAGGGYSPVNDNTIDYITIATTGNATDFGDLTQARGYSAGCSSPTRGVFAGGATTTGGGVLRGQVNTIDYVTIASAGIAIDFGDVTSIRGEMGGCSSPTRGLFGGGRFWSTPSQYILNNIDYITIASTGNATDFGDLTLARYTLGATSNSVRGVFAGGVPSTNTIDYVTIASAGNATDFGDLTSARYSLAGCSNSHGGL